VVDPMQPYAASEKAKTAAGAVAAIMATAMLFMIALGILLVM
jgi:hypothetical protein